MTIWTHGYAPVEIASARKVPTWITTYRGEVKWHYFDPTPSDQKRKRPQIIECFCDDIWHVTLKLAGHYPDGSGTIGELLYGGIEEPATHLKASGGWREIEEACQKAPSSKWNIAPDIQGASLLLSEVNKRRKRA